MNTIRDEDFDYQAYTRDNPPDPEKIHRGYEARKQRLEAARLKSAIQIDKDILERFRQMIPEGQSYERAINQALREWLSAKDMKELIRGELRQMVQQTLSTMHVAA
ncbi:hypothetical protein HUU05_08205 [candidate division KSB1 bacterium]|nr:hypothetical protein [candidate division KSB1 bacterium]